MNPRPADFAVRYGWQEGSVPPPDHYSFEIALGPGPAGQLAFTPDYANFAPPTWTEAFPVTEADLDGLYALAEAAGLFRSRWTPVEDPAIGGALEWATLAWSGDVYAIPGVLSVEDQTAVQPLYAAIRARVPPALWARMENRRQAYARGRQ